MKAIEKVSCNFKGVSNITYMGTLYPKGLLLVIKVSLESIQVNLIWDINVWLLQYLVGEIWCIQHYSLSFVAYRM